MYNKQWKYDFGYFFEISDLKGAFRYYCHITKVSVFWIDLKYMYTISAVALG